MEEGNGSCCVVKGGFSLLVPYGLLFSGRYYYFICNVIGIQKAINHIKWEGKGMNIWDLRDNLDEQFYEKRVYEF